MIPGPLQQGDKVYCRGHGVSTVLDTRPTDNDYAVDLIGGETVMLEDDLVVATDHACDRWNERVACAGARSRAAVIAAWARSEPASGRHGRDAEEVRFDPVTGAALLRNDRSIMTVIGTEDMCKTLRRAMP